MLGRKIAGSPQPARRKALVLPQATVRLAQNVQSFLGRDSSHVADGKWIWFPPIRLRVTFEADPKRDDVDFARGDSEQFRHRRGAELTDRDESVDGRHVRPDKPK